MRKRYHSDVYEPDDEREPEFIRANRRALRRLVIGVLILLALELAALLWLRPAHADEWTPPEIHCTPTVSDYDHAYQIQDAIVAVVWWCDEPQGLWTMWVTGTAPGAITPQTQADALLRMAGTDPLELLHSIIRRASTPTEVELVAKVEIAHAPHCYVIGTAATAAVLTSTAQGTLGPAKLDAAGVGIRVPVGAPVSCQERLAKETLKRYCAAATLTDTKGRRVASETWVPCKMERAPAGGWVP